jgi:hypothetical protein
LSLGALSVALSVAGCKQSDGERCEIDSDCASGICGPSGAATGMTSAAGLRCVAMLGSQTPVDAGSNDTGVIPNDGSATETGGDAASEAGSDAAVDAGSDAATDAASEAGSDAATEAGTDVAPSADGSADAGTDGANG